MSAQQNNQGVIMSNELERVARALFEWAIHEHSDPKPTWDDSEGMRETFMSGATVAIAAMTTTPDPQDLERALAAAWESKGTTLTWKQVCDSENPNIMQVRRGLVRQVTAAIAAMTPTQVVDPGEQLLRDIFETPTPDVGVLAEIRKAECEAIAGWHESRADELRFIAARYFRLGQREAGKITEAELHTHRISAIDIRNGEHLKP